MEMEDTKENKVMGLTNFKELYVILDSPKKYEKISFELKGDIWTQVKRIYKK